MLIIAITAAPRRTRRARPTRHDRNHRRAEPPMPQRARRRCRSMPQSAVGDNAVMVSAMCELVSVCFDRLGIVYSVHRAHFCRHLFTSHLGEHPRWHHLFDGKTLCLLFFICCWFMMLNENTIRSFPNHVINAFVVEVPTAVDKTVREYVIYVNQLLCYSVMIAALSTRSNALVLRLWISENGAIYIGLLLLLCSASVPVLFCTYMALCWLHIICYWLRSEESSDIALLTCDCEGLFLYLTFAVVMETGNVVMAVFVCVICSDMIVLWVWCPLTW